MNADLKKLADLFYIAFAGEGGATVLRHLRASTAPMQYAPVRDGVALDGHALALEAAYREGQRALLATIEFMVETAKTGKTPAERATI